MSDASQWIRDHLSSAPDALLDVMISAVRDREHDSAPDGLAEGAVSLYRAVLSGSGGREDALVLLAADALFTHAFQAQAELAPERLGQFASRWGGHGRLEELLP